jgi:hypothetical protein
VCSQSAKAALIWELAKAGNTTALGQALLGASEADLSFEQLCGVRKWWRPELTRYPTPRFMFVCRNLMILHCTLPVMIAAKHGHVDATLMLIAAGIDVNRRDQRYGNNVTK